MELRCAGLAPIFVSKEPLAIELITGRDRMANAAKPMKGGKKLVAGKKIEKKQTLTIQY